MATIMELKEQKVKIVAQLRQAVDGKNGLTAEEREKFDKALAEARDVSDQINRLEQVEGFESELRAVEPRQTGLVVTSQAELDQTERRAAFMKVYKPRFEAALRSWIANKAAPTSIEVRNFTDVAQSIGVLADGGILAPDQYVAEILKKASPQMVMRRLGTVKQTSLGTYKSFRRVTRPVAAQTDEKASFTRGKVTWEEYGIDVHKMTLEIPVTHEMLEDSLFDMQAEITEAIGEAFADLGEAWYVNGTGTKEAFGIVGRSQLGVTSAAIALTIDDLKRLLHSVKGKYRSGPKVGYLLNDSTLLTIGLIKDDAGHYYVQPDIRERSEFVVHTKPIYISDSMPNVAANAKPILFGDYAYYMIADRQTYFQVDPYSESSNGVILIKAFVRTGGDLRLTEAVSHLKMPAA